MEIDIKGWLNRRAGGIWVGIVIIIAFASIKLAFVGLSWDFLYFSAWFSLIVFSALAFDLFEELESEWIYNSLRKIELDSSTPRERIQMIHDELDIAVKQHLSLMLAANGLEKFVVKIIAKFSLVTKGVISIKEMIVIVAYAFYDIVIAGGTTNIKSAASFLIIGFYVILKIVDATRGAAGVIALIYNEAKKQTDAVKEMAEISKLIKLLSQKIGIEYDKCDDVTKEEIKIEIAEKNIQ
ncbi:MAG: hypothetical protein ACFFA4_16850 [Promethearchaeota archaeon]